MGIRRRIKGERKAVDVWQTLDFSPEMFIQRFERLFVEGMSWDNIDDWHIDHIRPVSSFTFTSVDDPEFKACWALENLQPLWAFDNMSKGAKWEGLTDAEA